MTTTLTSLTTPTTSTGLRVVVLGLSITSSWGNGHATTYRSLLRELSARGHRVRFLERDVPWYAANRDAGATTRRALARGRVFLACISGQRARAGGGGTAPGVVRVTGRRAAVSQHAE